MLTAILKIKTTLTQAAAEALAVFGEGGNPEAAQVEDYLGIVNTPEINGYVRLAIPPSFGLALEYIAANGGSEHADLVRVEWDGQEEFIVGMESGEGEDKRPIYLGVIA